MVIHVALVAQPRGGSAVRKDAADGVSGATGLEDVMVRRRLQEGFRGRERLAELTAKLGDGADVVELALLVSGDGEALSPLQDG